MRAICGGPCLARNELRINCGACFVNIACQSGASGRCSSSASFATLAWSAGSSAHDRAEGADQRDSPPRATPDLCRHCVTTDPRQVYNEHPHLSISREQYSIKAGQARCRVSHRCSCATMSTHLYTTRCGRKALHGHQASRTVRRLGALQNSRARVSTRDRTRVLHDQSTQLHVHHGLPADGSGSSCQRASK